MAWRLGYGKQNKEAERHIRADKKRAALVDAADPDAPHKKLARDKKFGIRLVQKNFFTKKQMSYCEWFETDTAREIAYQKAKTQETSPGAQMTWLCHHTAVQGLLVGWFLGTTAYFVGAIIWAWRR